MRNSGYNEAQDFTVHMGRCLAILVSLFSFLVKHGFFEPLTMPEVRLLAMIVAGLSGTFCQPGQSPKQHPE